MNKRRFSKPYSQALLSWLCLVLVMAACTAPAPTASPIAMTTEPPSATPEVTTAVPTEITPESTVAPPTATPTEIVEGYNLPVFSTEAHDCVIAEAVETRQAVPGEGYLQDQVILTGEPDFIQRAVQSFPQQFQGGEGLTNPLPPVFLQETGLDVRLYSVTLADQPLLEFINEINSRAVAPDDPWRVLAEPNYITRLPAGITEGSGDGGSGIVGDPGGVMAPTSYGSDQFIRQWALSGSGSIRLFDDANPHDWTPGQYTGTGVRVVVFDTTPLPAGDHDIYWSVAPFHLCVWQPGLRFEDPEPPADGVERIPKAEHGLFVAGMAHGLAPESEYYLIEVLNDQARGDVYSLVRAIALYLNEPFADPRNINTIFNLSLGLEILHDEDTTLRVEPATSSLIDNLNTNFSDSPGLMDLADQFPVPALKIATMAAEQMEVMIIAAAGNDARDIQQAPASFEEVLGVAATDSEKNAACFTNPGDLAAPGGDGDAQGSCEEETPQFCPNGTENCIYAVISTVTQKPESLSGYAYWTGTSFSSPMVSGLAALVRQKNGDLIPGEVRDAILCGVEAGTGSDVLGEGIIDVEKTMLSCVAEAPTPTPEATQTSTPTP